jgi:hypothetical protein
MMRLDNRTPTPDDFRTFKLNRGRLTEILDSAPDESLRATPAIMELPMPDGRLEKFRIERSVIVEPGLLAKYPQLGETFRGVGVDDPTASVRFDFLPTGLHAMILSTNGTVIINPLAKDDVENYVTFNKGDLARTTEVKCEVGTSDYEELINADLIRERTLAPEAPQLSSGQTLRTYRLALAGNWEYCNAAGGNTVAGCLAAMVQIMNRVNGVYERDLGIRMVMVANNDRIAYAGDNMLCPFGTGGTACTSANDPYSNTTAALNQNTPHLNAAIGAANYDMGHVFTTGSGGVANLGVPCGSNKGGGTTGLPNPVGDPFAIDFVAHEMGHQWGANHTFNASCGNNRSAQSAYEPGSGVTIMGYAGVCGSGQDLARNSIDTFHYRSLEVITAYSQVGNGSTCGTTAPTGNTPPEVSIQGGIIFDVPKQTPFTLTAVATDADGDSVTYDWQQYDLGATATAVPNSDINGAIPIFRSYLPTTSGSRTFPSSQYILANASVPPSTFGSCPGGFLCMVGELMPQIGRAMQFQVIARDNRLGGGGFSTAMANVAVDGNSGPFAITSPADGATFAGGSTQTITWSVNNTNVAPVNAANVRILLSTDGGVTFPTVLVASTPNDGSETVVIPQLASRRARIKLEAIGKIFFDISDVNITTTVDAAVIVSGRVTSPAGNPLRDVKVSLIDAEGNRRVATTSSFGEYVFTAVPGGITYTMTASSKRYRFAPKSTVVGIANVGLVDFVALQ